QPTINPVFANHYEGTRQFQDSLLKWMGAQEDYLAYLQNYWKTNIFPSQSAQADFRTFWAQSLHDGGFRPAGATTVTATGTPAAPTTSAPAEAGGQADYDKAAAMATVHKSGKLELFVYDKIAIGSGNQNNNPWLMELPDPVSKVTWDNYITMNP